MHERRPAAHEERPAAPEHDRRRERELRATRARAAARACAHRLRRAACRPSRSTSSGQRQREADPEAPRHVGELGVRPPRATTTVAARAPCRRSGTRPGRRARSPGASGRCRCARRTPAVARRGWWSAARRRDVAGGGRDELLAASRAAEPVRHVGVLGAAACRLARCDVHAAHRILHRGRGRTVAVPDVMTGLMILMAHGPPPAHVCRDVPAEQETASVVSCGMRSSLASSRRPVVGPPRAAQWCLRKPTSLMLFQ